MISHKIQYGCYRAGGPHLLQAGQGQGSRGRPPPERTPVGHRVMGLQQPQRLRQPPHRHQVGEAGPAGGWERYIIVYI